MKVASVTVTYNPDINVLTSQLESLRGQVDILLIVDNGSDESAEIEKISKEFGVIYIPLEENKGLAYAQNIGVIDAKKIGAEYVLLLDQDSILTSGFVNNMHSIYVGNKVDILGPVFFDPDTNVFYKGTNYFGPFLNTQIVGNLTDVTFVIASGSFFSIEVFDRVGPMNEDLFVDYIDVDWSLRAKNLGCRVAMTNSASMSHTIGDSRVSVFGRTISVHSPIRRYFLVRNSLFIIRQPYIPFGYKLREVCLNFARVIVSVFNTEEKLFTLSMAYKGFKDGLLGRFGPYRQ
ncbi:glycosyltransferase family 2 protein [Shewanella sp. PP-He15 brown]